MKEYELKYGCNPNQKPAKIYLASGGELPVEILNGRPGYINFLDALNGWQLVSELKAALKKPAAASFKHVSPTSASVGEPLDGALKRACFADDIPGLDDSPIACAYARARGADRLSSYGDFASLSDVCDETTARLLLREVSDGVIAPGYTPKALELLRQKRKGTYNIIKIDPDYEPPEQETKQVFGVAFEQRRNDVEIGEDCLQNVVTKSRTLPESAKRDLIVSLITLKYTQSNSVCFACGGQAIGVGAGQQSRIHCTRLAAGKADTWQLRQHEKVLELPFLPEIKRAERDNAVDAYINRNEEDILADGVWQRYFTKRPDPLTQEEKRAFLDLVTGVSLGSDAFFPFSDSILRAHMSGTDFVAQPGGSFRDADVIAACNRFGIAMAFTGIRLFHH
jgi:AICAR transformylase/IMP cyclohydrolase PurH